MTADAAVSDNRRRLTGDIAIVGMSGRFPGASDITALWRNLRAGVESITALDADELAAEGVGEQLRTSAEYVPAAPLLDDIDRFDARFFGFTAREAALLDPQHRLFLECAWHAVENASIDPARCGTAGVFAGANMPAYLMSNLLGGNRIVLDSTIFELQIHNDKDYLASRTAYKLGLTGPAVSVQTACSTSLVAVHQAAQSLLSGDCEVALAGGVCVRVPHRVGYRYEPGMIYSPDGHCRPFDADAGGTVFGNGVGVVVLKRLVDAERAGDRVLAVVKGSAVNNDGADKVGYTSPSAEGQEAVIADALAASGLSARSVTAIEAHGTGTPIGDPIEIAALSRAFARSTSDTGFCAVSSIKSNIGHLESAAGIASLIKAILQLRHRELVPSLHFAEPNPRIDFDSTPFRVNAELTDWADGGEPRRIGVSSFGIGGTNAHLVLEEAPEPAAVEPTDTDRPRVVLLSARSPEALDAATETLAGALAQPDAPVLADVAHTLHAGRQAMRYRRAVLATDTAEAAQLLSGAEPARLRGADAGVGGARLVLLFPGQGAQHAGMGRDLYQHEPVFTRVVDECAELLAEPLGLDLRTALYSGETDTLTSTELAQPALFVTEYALARVLENWGVHADAMVGHSIGEFTAACLAGVLSLPDALRLVAARGRLMRELPSGSMLSVAAPEDEITPLLTDGVAIAAVNAPTLCVLSGPDDEVAAIADILAAREITTRPLHTSHAFHSPMMDPVVEPVTALARSVTFHEPARSFVSCVTGDWITPEQAHDPEYWGSHLRTPVRFGDALRTAVDGGPVVLVEVGPGNTLSTLSRAAGFDPSVRTATATTMRRPEDTADDVGTLLTALGDIWLFGGTVDWTAHNGPGTRVELPGYPFQRERYWIAPSAGEIATGQTLLVPEESNEEQPKQRSNRPGTLLAVYAEPRDDTERRVTEVWEEFFGISPIGIQDNFFELGGHSLLATQILNRLRDRLGATVPMSALLSTPTVAGITAALDVDRPGEDALPELVADPDSRHEPFPLTEMQQAQWIGRLANFDMGGVAPHLYHEFDSETLDLAQLERAWQRVVQRHEMLRMVVLPDGRQRILPDVAPYRFEVLDLREATVETAEAELAAIRDRMSTEVRRADTWPLWEIRVSLLDAHKIRVHISFDLLVADVSGFFYQILPQWRDFYHEPEIEPGELTLSFRDYVLAEEALQRTDRYERALDYWRERVRELPPAPELPTATGGDQRSEFVRRHARLDAEQWGRIKARAGEWGVTPSSALLAAFAVTIGTWSKNQRFTLNFTAVNRLPVHDQVDDIVGEFASFDLLEVDAATPETFVDLVKALQKQSWEDFEHRLVSGVRILRERARARGTSTSDVMPVVFTSALSNDVDGKPAISPVDWLGEQNYFISQTPQVTIDHFLLEFEGNLELAWHAVDGLFPDGLMAEMFEAYQRFVVALAEPEGWTCAPVLPLPDWQREIRASVNDTAGPLPDDLLVTPILERAKSQDVALIGEDRTLTFAELIGRALRVTDELAGLGFGRGSVVGVGLAKSWQQVVAVLGVSAAGCTYVPLDPDLPESRRSWLIDQAGVECVVTGEGREPDWPWAPHTIAVAEDVDPSEVDTSARRCPAEPDDTAYVIYTSGSTGTPKGVAVSHRAARNTLVDINERYAVGPRDRVLALSSLSFDLSVYDVFGVLGAGAAVVLPEASARRDPARWRELIREHRVTVWNSVPALLGMLVEHVEAGGAEDVTSLRVALLSGDWIPLRLPDRMRTCVPGVEVISLGGATEAAVWSISYPIGEVRSDWPSIPYGTPLRNQRFHVLNDRWQPAPVWVPGQLFIGGAGVAEGYWNDEQRTAESFVTHPDTGERLYRTGDLGRYLPDGTIEFLGRDDFQVKIGGFRIELGEIEHALTEHPRVSDAVASAIGPRTQQRLVAHVVAEGAVDDPASFTEALRAHLTATVPGYLIPSDFVLIDAIPLSANGKVDRSALPDPQRASGGGEDAEPSDAATATLLGLAAELLGVENLSPGDNFFELGGDSIMGVQLVSRANIESIAITPQALFESDTFAALARSAGGDEVDTAGAGDGVRLTAHQEALRRASGSVRFDVSAEFDPAVAEQAWRALLERHTALRVRVRDEDTGPHAHAGDAEECSVPEIDLRRLSGREQDEAVRSMVAEIAEELDPAHGVVVKLALFRLSDDTAQLAWIVARGVLDDTSLTLLREEFTVAYQRIEQGLAPRWERAADCALRWNHGLRRELVHPDLDAAAAPPEFDGEALARIDATETRRSTAEIAGAHHLELSEVLVAVLAHACHAVLPEPPVLLVERGLRAEADISAEHGEYVIGRTTELHAVGPFTEVEPGALLAAIKSELRAGRSAPLDGLVLAVGELVRWNPAAVLAMPEESAGLRPDTGYPGAVGQVGVAVVDGELRICWRGDDQNRAERLAVACTDALRVLSEHCRALDSGRYEPSDFPLAGLSSAELDDFLGELN